MFFHVLQKVQSAQIYSSLYKEIQGKGKHAEEKCLEYSIVKIAKEKKKQNY